MCINCFSLELTQVDSILGADESSERTQQSTSPRAGTPRLIDQGACD